MTASQTELHPSSVALERESDSELSELSDSLESLESVDEQELECVFSDRLVLFEVSSLLEGPEEEEELTIEKPQR